MSEQLAVIRNPSLGVYDRGYVVLKFDAYTSEGLCAMQILYLEGPSADRDRALDLLRTVSDVSELDGRVCWVDRTPGMTIYNRPADI